MAKIKIDDIKEKLESQKWKLISEEYKNLDSEIITSCPEGHIVYSNWKSLREKPICPICKQNQLKEPQNITIIKKQGKYRILALDQATKITGFSIYDDKKLIKYGTFIASDSLPEIERLYQIKMWLVSMIENLNPDLIALEGIQYQEGFGVTTFETLAHLKGVLLEAIFEMKIESKVIPPATWRSHCGVKGRARADQKKSMQLLVKSWYDISLTDDCADAIGLGKCASDTFIPKLEVNNWE